MKLIFEKKENGDISVLIQKGTITESFNYIEMLKQLLEKNEIEDPDFSGFEEIEENKIKELLEKIKTEVENAGLINID